MTIRKRRLLVLLIVVLIVSGIVTGLKIAFFEAQKTAVSHAEQILSDNAREQVSTLSFILAGKLQLLTVLAASDFPVRSDSATETESLQAAAKKSGMEYLFFVDSDGIARYSGRPELNGRNYSLQPYFKNALNNTESMVYVEADDFYDGGVLLSVPVRNNGKVFGALCGLVNKNKLSLLLMSKSYNGNGYSYVIDSDGQIILDAMSKNFILHGGTIFDFYKSDKIKYLNGCSFDELLSCIKERSNYSLHFLYGKERRDAVVLPLDSKFLPENNWVLFNVVNHSELLPEIKSTMATVFTSILVLSVFLFSSLAIFVLLEKNAAYQINDTVSRLKESEDRYRAVSENIGIGLAIVRVDVDGSMHLLFKNEGLLSILKMTWEQFDTTYLNDLVAGVHPEDVGRAKAFFASVKEDGDRNEISFRLTTGLGTYVWCLVKIWLSVNSGKKILYVSFVDNSLQQREREQYERELIVHEQLASSNMVAWAQVNLTENEVDSYTPVAAWVFKYNSHLPYSENIKASFKGITLKENRNKLIKKTDCKFLCESFERGNTELSENYLRLREDGKTPVVINLSIKLFSDAYSNDVLGLLTWSDITQQRVEELSLQKIASTNYDFIANINCGTKIMNTIYAVNGPDINGRSYDEIYDLYLNKHDYDMGYSYEDGTPFGPDQLTLENIKKIVDKEGVFSFYEKITSNGGKKQAFFLIKYLYLTERKYNMLLLRSNITFAQQAEQNRRDELQKALTEAKQSSHAKSDFLSRMSHDIRTPMNAVINLVELAKDELDNKEMLVSDLDKLAVSGKFLLGLINDILDMSRIESGKFDLNPEVYSYKEFNSYLDAVIVPLCSKKKITFTWDRNLDIPDVFTDKTRFNQISFNILSNAVKYTGENGKIGMSLVQKTLENGISSIDLVFSDNGIGMSRQFQKKLFQPFEREDTSNAYLGTGLGLAITKAIVEKMGGTISVKSAKGKGTEFMLHLNLAIATPEQIAAAGKNGAEKCLKILRGKHILLCEDNSINSMLAVRLLEKGGMKVDVTENGRLAVKKFKNSTLFYYDAILMDLRMPVMDGFAATKKIRSMEDREDALNVPIIAMTADAFTEDVEKCMAAGMNGHIAKPLEQEKMFNIILNKINGGGLFEMN